MINWSYFYRFALDWRCFAIIFFAGLLSRKYAIDDDRKLRSVSMVEVVGLH